MIQRGYFSLTFFVSKAKKKRNGECPIMLKININVDKTKFHTKRSIKLSEWDNKSHRVKGKKTDAIILNDYLNTLTYKCNKIYNDLLNKHEVITAKMIKDELAGNSEQSRKTLINVWEDHNKELLCLVGKEVSKDTYQKYERCKNHFIKFLYSKNKQKDIFVGQVNYELVNSFFTFLKTDCGCAHNTAVKFMHNLKKIIQIIKHNGWITHDPFYGIKMKEKVVARPYLTEQELIRILEYKPKIERLSRVKDFFLFSCFTGLAYIDVKNLCGKNIIKSSNTYWVKTHRKKTSTNANIPLLPVPIKIIKKYNNIDNLNDNERVIPILSNQKTNSYLKEIADLCGINKKLSFHVARHTFATTVTLTNGVPLESVSKMLGHKDLKTTQHYARIVDLKVGEDMEVLNNKLQQNSVYI
jgi:site-specific recombinase XerD